MSDGPPCPPAVWPESFTAPAAAAAAAAAIDALNDAPALVAALEGGRGPFASGTPFAGDVFGERFSRDRKADVVPSVIAPRGG